MNINERNGVNPARFRILDHSADAILQDLELEDLGSISNVSGNSITFNTSDGIDTFTYRVTMQPFRIEQRVNGHLTAVVNKKDTLMFEDYNRFY